MVTSKLQSTALAAAVLHEVRRLLTPVKGYAELAVRQPGLGPEAAKGLLAAIEAVNACDAVMETLVGASRVQGASAPSDVAMAWNSRAGVVVESKSSLQVPMSFAALEAVLSNLIANARRADPGGLVQISISESATGNTPRVIIRVSDSGVGMTEEERERAAIPFVSNTASSGLGLAICKHLIEEAGGSMRIESRAGAGTRVTVDLPSVNSLRKSA